MTNSFLPLDAPVSGDELQRLEDFLLEESCLKQPMNLELLDGFLTALAVGPETLMPGEWLPVVWDIYGEGGSPEFRSAEQAEEIIGIIMRLMNTIVSTLREYPDEYEPLPDLVEYPDESDRLSSLRSWCIGFMIGVELREASWAPLHEDHEGSLAITPIAAVAGLFDETTSIDEKETVSLWTAIPDAVLEISEFWMPYRQRAFDRTKRNHSMTVGRNDSCPCGSGLKFKKCCGKPA